MKKPKVGDYYIIFGIVIQILRINGSKAFYRAIDGNSDMSPYPWDFVKYPAGVDRKLTSLEIELL